MQKDTILKDLGTLSYKMIREKSLNRKSLYVANYVSLTELLKLTEEDNLIMPGSNEILEGIKVFNDRVKKDKKIYLDYLITTIEDSISLSDIVLDIFHKNDYYPYYYKCMDRLDENHTADYIISFSTFMGDEVLSMLAKMYGEDRIGYFRNDGLNGLTTSANFINSNYITYAHKNDYYDSLTLAHELGHVMHEKLYYERGLFKILGTIYDEALSQFMELAYIDYLKKYDKNAYKLENGSLRVFYKECLGVNLIFYLLESELLYACGPDFKSKAETFEIEDFPYNDIVNDLVSDYSYSKYLTYFIGMVIANHFINLDEDPKVSLKELKNYLSIAPSLSFESNIERLNLNDNDKCTLIKRINNTKKEW